MSDEPLNPTTTELPPISLVESPPSVPDLVASTASTASTAPTAPTAPTDEKTNEPPATQVAADRLRPLLAEAFRRFEKQDLVVLQWVATGVKRGDGSEERGGATITLESVKVTRQTGITLNLQWRPMKGAAIKVEVPLSLYVRKDAIALRTWTFGRVRDWPLVRDSVLEQWVIGETVDSSYPTPRGVPGLELLGETWFSSGNQRSRAGVHATQLERAVSIAKYWAKYRDEKWNVALPGFPRDANPEGIAEIAAAMLGFVLWTAMVQLFQGDSAEGEGAQLDPHAYGLPGGDLYWPRRPVDLNPNEVREHLETKEGLRLPWHLIEAACSSLNAGKHVIFTGPPGCGKSKLAIALAKLAKGGLDPLTVTASPAWSSGDLVGRYMPRLDGRGLVFKPGFFLRSIDEDRWLVIDEFNRADIDQCFGELFSVLAHDAVTLPFEDVLEDGIQVPIRILPAKGHDADGAASAAGQRFRAYRVSPAFRLIGTMNDADRASLSQLSFALLRRFDVIRVEAPPPDTVAQIIKTRVKAADDALVGRQYIFKQDVRFARQIGPVTLESVRESLLNWLFARSHAANEASSHDRKFTDLVADRVIGLATVQDAIQFVAEGLRRPDQVLKDGDTFVKLSKSDDTFEDIQPVAASYLAMAIVLSVFPQLDALPDDRFDLAVQHILDAFGETPFKRIQLNMDPATKKDFPYCLEHVDAATSGIVDADRNGKISTQEFLLNELCLQYRGAPREVRLRAMLPKRLPEAGRAGVGAP